jgi:hypothetical protein
VQQFCSAGVPSSQVWSADLCTACHPEWFYSYRRDGPQSGRMLNVIMIEANMSPAFHSSLGGARSEGPDGGPVSGPGLHNPMHPRRFGSPTW